MKRILVSFALLGLIVPQSLFAEEGTGPGPTASAGTATGNVSCFDYYQFGSVATSLEADLAQTVPGANITFSGTITNKNDYPVVDGNLFVKIFHTDEATFGVGDGNPVVDQFFVEGSFNLPAQGEQKVSFSWHVPENIAGGEYYAATFFTTENRYNLSGLSFTDDVIGSSTSFSVTSDQKGGVFLDKTKTTLNGQEHHFAAYPLHFKNDEMVETKVTLTNPSSEDQVVQLIWEEYTWDAMRAENLQNKRFDLVEIAANSSKEVAYQVTSKGKSVSYVVATTKDQYSKSVQGIRFVRDGIEETRINFPSLTKFPLKSGEQNSLFACAHATNLPLVKGNILTLTLRDENQSIIHEYKYEGDISGAMSGWKDDFTPSKDYSKVFLTATLQRNNQVVEEVTIPYDCEAIDKNLCDQSNSFSHLSKTKKIGVLLIILLSLFALGAIFFSKTKNKSPNRFKVFFLLLMAGGMFFGGVKGVEGKGVSWNKTETNDLAYYWNCSGACPFGANGWEPGLTAPSITVRYNADVFDAGSGAIIPDGSVLTQGTRLRFQPRVHSAVDVDWFGSGVTNDSPNGQWISGANAPTFACLPSDESGTGVFDGVGNRYNVYTPYSVNPPTNSLDFTGTTATLTDQGGGVYRIDSPGVIRTQFVFSPTYGKFYYRYKMTAKSFSTLNLNQCYGNQSAMEEITATMAPPFCIPVMGIVCPGPTYQHSNYQTNIPEQRIAFNFNVPGSNNPPAVPTLTGPTTGSPSTNYPYDTRASDPDGDTVRYGIDWDNNNTVDEWTGYVPSSTNVVTNHMWPFVGSNTFKALAQDSNGASSGWSIPLTMVIAIGGGPGTCVVPSGGSTPDGTEAQLIDDCAASAGPGYRRPGDFTNATLLKNGSDYIVCHDNSSIAWQVCAAGPGASQFAWSGQAICNQAYPACTTATNGICGAAQGFPTTNPPIVGGLCTSGTPSAVTPGVAPGPYSWTCSGSGGGSDVTCDAPYLEPAPVVDLKINGSDGPLTVSRNANLNIVWGNVANAASCSGSGNNWDTPPAKSVLGGNDNISATTASLYTITCTNSQGITGSDSISVTLANTFKICQNSCDGGDVPDPLGMVQGSTRQIVGCFNDAVACTDPTGDVTGATSWADGGGPEVTISNGLITAVQEGSENITGTYSSSTQTRRVDVSCVAQSCSASEALKYCTNETFSWPTGCAVTPTQTCSGSKSCDFNWKEVAP